MQIMEAAREVGKVQYQRVHSSPLVELARNAASAAASGLIDEEDAMDVYCAYYRESTGLRPARHVPSIKVNASKLRQIIRCADPSLLDVVTTLHREYSKHRKVRPLYPCMVDVCRAHNELGRKPSVTHLKQLILQPRR